MIFIWNFLYYHIVLDIMLVQFFKQENFFMNVREKKSEKESLHVFIEGSKCVVIKKLSWVAGVISLSWTIVHTTE
jgi:hypothetical protein